MLPPRGTETLPVIEDQDREQLVHHPFGLREFVSLLGAHRGRVVKVCLYSALSLCGPVLSPFLLRHLINSAFPSDQFSAVAVDCLGIAIFALVSQLSMWRQGILSSELSEVLGKDLRDSIFIKALVLPLEFYTSGRESDVRTRMATDVVAVRSALAVQLPALLQNCLLALGILVGMLVMAWPMALVSLALLIVIAFATRRSARSKAAASSKVQDALGEIQARVSTITTLDGITATRLNGETQNEQNSFLRLSEETAIAGLSSARAGKTRSLWIGITFAILPAFVYLGGFGIQVLTPVTIGTVIAFASMQNSLYRPLVGTINAHLQLISARALLSRITELIGVESREFGSSFAMAEVGGPPLVAVEDVAVVYPSGKKVLEGVSLTVVPGDRIGVAGPSGSGKSTLVRVMTNLLLPTTGSVTFSGICGSELSPDGLSRVMEVVPQDVKFARAPVRNIVCGGDRCDENRVWEVLSAFELEAVVEYAGKGLDVTVGPGGLILSGGEIRRLALARTCYRSRAVVILDEAITGLDRRSVDIALDVLEKYLKDSGVVVVSHDPYVLSHMCEVISLGIDAADGSASLSLERGGDGEGAVWN